MARKKKEVTIPDGIKVQDSLDTGLAISDTKHDLESISKGSIWEDVRVANQVIFRRYCMVRFRELTFLPSHGEVMSMIVGHMGVESICANDNICIVTYSRDDITMSAHIPMSVISSLIPDGSKDALNEWRRRSL